MHNSRFQRFFSVSGRISTYLLLSLGSLLLSQSCTNDVEPDTCHTKSAQIYRVSSDQSGTTNGGSPNALAPLAAERVAGVKTAVRLLQHGFGEPALVKTGESQALEDGLYYADSTLFQVFDFQFVQGQLDNPLSSPDAVVLSESAARRYFGNRNPIGCTLHVDNQQELHVTGVYRDQPDNSSLRPAMVGALAANKWAVRHLNWDDTSYTTFLLLTPDADPNNVTTNLRAEQAKTLGEGVPSTGIYLLPLKGGTHYTSGQNSADGSPTCYAPAAKSYSTVARSAVE